VGGQGESPGCRLPAGPLPAVFEGEHHVGQLALADRRPNGRSGFRPSGHRKEATGRNWAPEVDRTTPGSGARSASTQQGRVGRRAQGLVRIAARKPSGWSCAAHHTSVVDQAGQQRIARPATAPARTHVAKSAKNRAPNPPARGGRLAAAHHGPPPFAGSGRPDHSGAIWRQGPGRFQTSRCCSSDQGDRPGLIGMSGVVQGIGLWRANRSGPFIDVA